MLGNFGKHWHIGRTIYGKRTWRETRRTFLHTMRSCRHDSTVTEFENFFKSYTADPPAPFTQNTAANKKKQQEWKIHKYLQTK